MTHNHTPGPWTFEDEFVIGPNGEKICDPYARPTVETMPGEMEANARLIALAPELLANVRQNDYALETVERVLAERGVELKEITRQRARNREVMAKLKVD